MVKRARRKSATYDIEYVDWDGMTAVGEISAFMGDSYGGVETINELPHIVIQPPTPGGVLIKIPPGWKIIRYGEGGCGAIASDFFAAVYEDIPEGQGEPEELRSKTAEIRELVHAVDAMRDQWAESDSTRRADLWQRVHDASARALLDALTRHYAGAEDTRALRRDYDAERGRVDKLTGAVIDLAATLAAPTPPERTPR